MPSTRSLRRYLAILSEAGFPWFFERASNSYRFSDGYSLKRLELSNNELFGVVALRSLGASLGGAIGSYINGITDKLVGASRGASERVEAQSPVAFRMAEIGHDEAAERAFGQLSSAERSSRSAAFDYRDKEGRSSRRTVDPYGFVVSGGRVYCVAFDRSRTAMRTFALDSIANVTVLPTTFVKPKDFDIESFVAASISGVMHRDGASEVRVHFAPRVAKAASAARVVADRRVELRENGAVEIAYRVADVDELVRWVLGWGSQAEIVAPATARLRARELAHEIAIKYA